MKRDLDLIREIMLHFEESPAGEPAREFDFEGRSKAEVLEHIELLFDADYLEGHTIRDASGAPAACTVMRITWEGHEFLANARTDTVWTKTLTQIREKGASVSMTILNGLLEAAAKKYAGLES